MEINMTLQRVFLKPQDLEIMNIKVIFKKINLKQGFKLENQEMYFIFKKKMEIFGIFNNPTKQFPGPGEYKLAS